MVSNAPVSRFNKSNSRATTDTVTSNSTGHYTSNWDPIGTYTVTCSAPGHSTQTITGVQITTGGLTTVNCQI